VTNKIDAAIAAVTKAVKRLEKADRNSHGNYNFASIDDFLAMTGRLCGDAGLSVLMDEADFEIIPDMFATKQGKVAGLRMKFAITMRCDGEQAGPFHRSILVPANMGSQAFGAAQSYVLKQFLRATFQIPTGDKGEDIDAHDTGKMQQAPRCEMPDQVRSKIVGLCESVGGNQPALICKGYGVDAITDLSPSQAEAVIERLEQKLAEKAKAKTAEQAREAA